ncbi:hypothetical protein EXN66_Car014533 [Channa argus]|uniref:Uncharacterized protein n=1 Tax=Channa argus TaxID=215402 RepID=A0A6G1Q9L0_CHAAH|nr:hypothetical protein EXN66_Car014533 [Channa argus]
MRRGADGSMHKPPGGELDEGVKTHSLVGYCYSKGKKNRLEGGYMFCFLFRM